MLRYNKLTKIQCYNISWHWKSKDLMAKMVSQICQTFCQNKSYIYKEMYFDKF